MSILSQLLRKQITWKQAEQAVEVWGGQVEKQLSPAAVASVGLAVSDLKQAASNAIMLADSLAGPLLAVGADAAGAAFDVAAKAYLGPFAGAVSPAAHDAIDHVAAALKAEIDARAFAAKAILGTPPVTASLSTTMSAGGSATPGQPS